MEIEFAEIAPGIELEVVSNWPSLEESINSSSQAYKVRILATRRLGISTMLTSVKKSIEVRVFMQSPIVCLGW
jgi:hypothetical protein